MIDSDSKSFSRSEREQRKAARRRRIILWCLAPVVLAAVIVGGRHAYHYAKARRADQFATTGDDFAKAEKWTEAADQYRAALQLDPLGYHGLVGAARLAKRLGRPEAIDLWTEVVKLPAATTADRQEYVGLLVSLGKVKQAEPVLTELLKQDPDTTTLVLAVRYSQANGDQAKAVEFARAALKRAPDDDKARSALADVLANSTDAASRAEARQLLWEIAKKGGPLRAPALEALGRAPELPPEEQTRALQMLEEEKAPTLKASLLAADLRLQLHPDEANRVYDQLIARWNTSEDTDLNELARWLNVHQQGERVLSLYSLDRALKNNQLLLSRLDAMAILQRWNDIDSLLAQHELTLDPSVLESFRARTAQERGSNLDAEVHWSHAISLAGGDASKLKFVANYAEQSKATAVALKTYEQLAKNPEQAVFAYRATQRLSGAAGDSAVQRAAAEKIATLMPNDPNAAGQVAYLNLLAGTDVDANFDAAKALAEKYPERLSFRVTAALAYLRKHDPGLALKQFDGPPIEWQRTPPAWRAVYAAVLMANERDDEAKKITATIPADKLTLEERKLLEPEK